MASKQTTADKILAAALKCLSKRGSANVSLRDIADEAGVVLSQLNYYFENKEGLYAGILNVAFGSYLQELEAKMKRHQVYGLKVGACIKFHRDLLKAEKEVYQLYIDLINLAFWNKALQAPVREYMEQVARIIENQLKASEPASEKTGAAAATTARLILSTMYGIAIQHLVNPDSKEILRGFDVLQDHLN